MSELPVWWFSGVHLVDTNDQLLDTKGEGQESVFSGLTILGDTSFEFTNTSGDDEDSAISLGGTSDHVLDEITVTWGVNDGDVVLKISIIGRCNETLIKNVPNLILKKTFTKTQKLPCWSRISREQYRW